MWHLSLQVAFSWCICGVESVCFFSFLWMNDVPLYGSTSFCFSAHWLVAIGLFHFSAITNHAAMNTDLKVTV